MIKHSSAVLLVSLKLPTSSVTTFFGKLNGKAVMDLGSLGSGSLRDGMPPKYFSINGTAVAEFTAPTCDPVQQGKLSYSCFHEDMSAVNMLELMTTKAALFLFKHMFRPVLTHGTLNMRMRGPAHWINQKTAERHALANQFTAVHIDDTMIMVNSAGLWKL